MGSFCYLRAFLSLCGPFISLQGRLNSPKGHPPCWARDCSVWSSSLPLPLHQAGLPLPPSHSPCPPTQLSSFIPSCLSTNGHPLPEALPQRLSSTHFDCGAWSTPSFNTSLPLPCKDVSPPGQTLGCWLSPSSPLPSRCHYIYFDCWNLI